MIGAAPDSDFFAKTFNVFVPASEGHNEPYQRTPSVASRRYGKLNIDLLYYLIKLSERYNPFDDFESGNINDFLIEYRGE